MNKVNKAICVLLCVVFTHQLQAQKTPTFKWDKHKVTPVFKEFLAAYNTGSKTGLKGFVGRYYKPARVDNKTRYWLKVYSEYGAIVPYRITEKKENRMSVWFWGKATKNWVELTFVMNKKGDKLKGTGVMRGMRPKGALPPYKAMPAHQMTTYLGTYLKKLSAVGHFSGTVLVAKGSKILFEGAYGMRNKKAGLKNNLNTSFCMASVTKTFTAVAIAQLADKGKLKFNDYISKYIPEYPKDIAGQVTIHHLLTHTSGIELDDYEPFNQDILKARSVNDLVQAQIKHIDHMNEGRRKNFKVLGKHDYSNENYSLLGAIIERVSGMSYSQYITKRIFKPAGMKNSFVDYGKLAQHDNKAMGYTYLDDNYDFRPGKRRENTSMMPSMAVPAGGMYSSVRDLYAYYRAINTHKIVSKSTQQTLHKKHVKLFSDKILDADVYYGYGFKASRHGKAQLTGHAGRMAGVGARLDYYPTHDYYVIVLSNYGFPAQTVACHIRDLIEPND